MLPSLQFVLLHILYANCLVHIFDGWQGKVGFFNEKMGEAVFVCQVVLPQAGSVPEPCRVHEGSAVWGNRQRKEGTPARCQSSILPNR